MPTEVRIGPNKTPAEYVEFVSSTEVRARYMGGGAGDEDVEVTTSLGSATATGAFHATSQPRPPTIAEITPNRGPGGTIVTIRGTDFEP